MEAWPTTINARALDIAYYASRSGQKEIGPLVEALVEDGEVSASNWQLIASVLYSMYGEGWKRRYAVLSSEYNPIENYDRNESTTISGTNTGTISNTGSVGYGHVTTSNSSGTASNTQSKYAYDSENPAPETGASGTQSNNTTVTESGSDTNGNTQTNNLADSHTTSGRIHGNIGVTTTQQMLQSEIELWQWSFFESVFEDLDKMLVLSVYSI